VRAGKRGLDPELVHRMNEAGQEPVASLNYDGANGKLFAGDAATWLHSIKAETGHPKPPHGRVRA
jgi:hypothetical protein